AETHLVVVAYETYGIAPGAAREALEDLLGGDDAHGGLVIVVERAEADVLAPLRAERQVLADKPNNVGRVEHALLVVAMHRDHRVAAPCYPCKQDSRREPRHPEPRLTSPKT